MDSDEEAMAVLNSVVMSPFSIKARMSLSTARLKETLKIIKSVLVDELKHIFPKDITMTCKSA